MFLIFFYRSRLTDYCSLGLELELLKQPIGVSQDIISLFFACILDATATQATAGTNEQFKADGVRVQIYGEIEGLTV